MELVELSSKLSDEIIASALVQFEDLQTLERLLALLTTNRYASSRLLSCLGGLPGEPRKVKATQLSSGDGKQEPPAAGGAQSGCPYCSDGDGNLTLDEWDSWNRMKLIAMATSVALKLTGQAEIASKLLAPPDTCHLVPSLGELNSEKAINETYARPAGEVDSRTDPRKHLENQALAGHLMRGSSEVATDTGKGGEKPVDQNVVCEHVRSISSNQPADIITGLERALDNLRLEREALATQVQILKQCLDDKQDRFTPGTATASGGSSFINRPLVLSSNMQRMKRMDTLKRRKIKRDQQSLVSSPLSSASSAVEGSQPPPPMTAHHQSLVANDSSSGTHSSLSAGGGGPGGPAGAAILESAQEEMIADEEPIAQGQPQFSARPSVETPSTTPGQPEACQQPQMKNQQQSASATTAHIYQSFRTSLASLLNESVSQQQQRPMTDQQERRNRFSLNALGRGLSAAIGSPFSSPKKSFQQQSVSERRDTCGPRLQSGTSVSKKRRSSSSNSGGVGGNGNNNTTNCSCLKSSDSNHSVDSDNAVQNC